MQEYKLKFKNYLKSIPLSAGYRNFSFFIFHFEFEKGLAPHQISAISKLPRISWRNFLRGRNKFFSRRVETKAAAEISVAGFSLIEIIVYVAILGGISVFVVNFLLQITALQERVSAERAALSNARLILETLQRTAAQAKEIYVPTSRFNRNAGQLSLVTSLNPPAGEAAKYADFWVDNGALYVKEEGLATSTLSGVGVRVSKFYLERMVQGLGKEAVKITLQIDSTSRYSASVTLSAIAVLRGNY